MSRKIRLNRNSSRRLAGIAGLTGLAIAALTAVSLTSMTVSAQTGLGAGAHVAQSQQAPQNVSELRPAINEARAGTPRQVRVIPLFNTPDDQKNLLRR